jgi:hypothetical protein
MVSGGGTHFDGGPADSARKEDMVAAWSVDRLIDAPAEWDQQHRMLGLAS